MRFGRSGARARRRDQEFSAAESGNRPISGPKALAAAVHAPCRMFLCHPRSLALAIALSGFAAEAQTTQDNLDKYWRLRARLTTEFLRVGPAQGQSQPAQERHEGQKFIKFGDTTLVLGWYLGVLATEYELVRQPGRFPGADRANAAQVNLTLDELYYALLAMERLDEVAENAFPAPCTQSTALNGFFLRDDVPADFHLSVPGGLTVTMSDFVDPVLTNKEMSQDQVYHVLIGLSLVKRLVPANVVVKGKNLRAWAMQQAQRIGQHLSSSSWVIKNPACGGRSVNRGEQAVGYSAGTRLAFSFITDGAFVPSTSSLWNTAWSLLRSTSAPVYSDVDNLHMAMAIAAVGNGWGSTTATDLATLSGKEDWVAYPLLHSTLHGNAANGFCRVSAPINTVARTMLNELPSNGEPINPLPSGPAPHSFTTNHRFTRPKAQAYVGAPNAGGMRYSGLDYLLLHNLYALATPSTWEGGPGGDPCAVFDGGVPVDGGSGQDGGSGGGGGGGGSGGGSGVGGGAGGSGGGSGAGVGGGSGGGAGGGSAGGAGGGADGGVPGAGGGWTADAGEGDGPVTGCSCRASGGTQPLASLVLGLLLLWRLRRRARVQRVPSESGCRS